MQHELSRPLDRESLCDDAAKDAIRPYMQDLPRTEAKDIGEAVSSRVGYRGAQKPPPVNAIRVMTPVCGLRVAAILSPSRAGRR